MLPRPSYLRLAPSPAAVSGLRRCLLCLALLPPNLALAAEPIQAPPAVFDAADSLAPAARSPLDPTYEPDFLPFDRSIIGRAPAGVTALTNNVATPMNVVAGSTQFFVFSLPSVSGRAADEDLLERRDDGNLSLGRSAGAGAAEEYGGEQEDDNDEEGEHLAKRQSSRTVYISANTCEQPQPVNGTATTADPPQLTLYVATSASNQSPGPLADPGSQTVVPFTEGAVMYNLSTSRDTYIGIYAPNASQAWTGTYNFRVAASITDYYYSYDDQDDADLIWVDSDSQGALLMTHNLTDSTSPSVDAQVMSSEPYVLFAHNTKDRAINGLKYSFCGLQNYAQIAATKDGRHTSMVTTGMTTRGPGSLPKQQFFFSGLNSSAEYIAILAKDGNASSASSKRQTTTAAGETQVFKPTSFSTKSDHGNCALIVDLPFCDQVAYSVPSNPHFGNASQLAQFYDSYASSVYANFNKSLAQIACEAPSSQRYSLARNCTDCASAYKDWLCLVTIPRCEDFSSNATFLQPRAVGQPFPDNSTLDAATLASFPNTTSFNASRNPLIDSVVQPGPYKELLPCDDLCYKLVQNCPAQMQFGCPLPQQIGYAGNYAPQSPSGGLTCNFPGSAHYPSGSGRAVVDWGLLVAVVVAGLLVI